MPICLKYSGFLLPQKCEFKVYVCYSTFFLFEITNLTTSVTGLNFIPWQNEKTMTLHEKLNQLVFSVYPLGIGTSTCFLLLMRIHGLRAHKQDVQRKC